MSSSVETSATFLCIAVTSVLIRLPFVSAFIEKPPIDRALAELGRPGRHDRQHSLAGRRCHQYRGPCGSVRWFHPSTSSRTRIIGARTSEELDGPDDYLRRGARPRAGGPARARRSGRPSANGPRSRRAPAVGCWISWAGGAAAPIVDGGQ